MALLNILHYPNPLLRKKCNKVTEITKDIIGLADNMCETLAYHKGAVSYTHLTLPTKA